MVNRVDRRKFLGGAVSAATGMSLVSTSQQLGAGQQVAPTSKGPVIDTHMHVWSGDIKRWPFDHPYSPDFKSKTTAATGEILIEEMDRFGVTHCILVQTIFHGWDNTYTAYCLKKYPSRFKAHGLIDPTDPRVAEKLEFWVKEHQLSGMRFSPIYYVKGNHGGDDWLTSAAHHRVWKKAADLGAVFNFFIHTDQLPRLETMIQRYPQVSTVIDHMSQIDLGVDDPLPALKKLLALARYPNVAVKISDLTSVSKSGKYPFPDAYPWVKRVYDAFGPDRLLWGTGYPGAVRADFQRPTVKKELELIRQHVPFFTPQDRAKILGLNAARIWKLPLDKQPS
ncbi:MAG: amidohydrolase family protein [Pirellulaceae bacterium]